MNALRHGLTGRTVVMPNEDMAAYQAFCKELFDSLAPATPVENQFAQTFCDTQWRLNRIRSIEDSMFALGHFEPASNIDVNHPEAHAALTAARVFRDDSKSFVNLSLYEQRLQRILTNSLHQLQQLQTERIAQRQAAKKKARHSLPAPTRPPRSSFFQPLKSNSKPAANSISPTLLPLETGRLTPGTPVRLTLALSRDRMAPSNPGPSMTKTPVMRLFVLLPLAVAAASAASKAPPPHTTWSGYLGGPDSDQYSALKQVNKANVKQLEIAWTYPTGERGNYLFNPVIVDGVMYVLAKNNSVAALDAATGKELWIHPNEGAVGARGISYWESPDRSDRRLLYVNGGFLTAIDARTGKTILSFGDNGRSDLRTGLDRDLSTLRPLQTSNPGRIFENLLIQPLPAGGQSYNASPGDIHAYDVRTGKLVWSFHTVPHPGEFGYETWPADAWKTTGGVHNWNEMTLDEKHGIAYIPLGTARYDFYGPDRKGADLFGNSLLALDARTGKRLWHFQLVHHDLWDYDIPTAPKLLTVRHNGKNVEAIAQPTKQGFLFVFNRLTGEPLWPIEERPVPKSDVPGEESWPTQPFPTKPPPFARQSFTAKDIDPYLPEAERADLIEKFKTWRNDGLFTPPSLEGTVEMPGNNGGANWGSSAVDPAKGTMYIVSKELPMLMKLELPRPARGGARGGGGRGGPPPPPALVTSFIQYNAPYDFMLSRSNRLSAISPPWSQLTAYDLNTGTIKWQIPNGGVTALEEMGHPDTGAHFPRGGVIATGGGLIFVATASDRKIRAYDEDNGKVLWEKDLPAGSEGVPAVYQVAGREYLAFCVAAADGLMSTKVDTGKAAVPPGQGAYVVFALPQR